MSSLSLKKILSQKKDLKRVIEDIILLSNNPITVWNMENELLIGALGIHDDHSFETKMIIFEGQEIGYVKGEEPAGIITQLITILVNLEHEKISLGREILDRYREINLIYGLSKKLTNKLDLNFVAKVTLNEAKRLIPDTLGLISIKDFSSENFKRIASFGNEGVLNSNSDLIDRFIDRVTTSGKAKIENNVNSINYNSINSIICAPITAKEKSVGAIFLANEGPITYTAGDLKLLNTVAIQTAPAIEYALLHAQALDKAKKHEAVLQKQIQELRIELNEAKQKYKVAEITESDYFQRLRNQADGLRDIINN